MAGFRFGRLRSLLLAIGAIFLISTFYLYWTPAPASMIPSTAFEVPLTERQIAFWKTLKPILEKNAPSCPPPTRRADAQANHYNPNATDPRPDLILLKENDRKAMEEAHANYLRDIREAERLRPPHVTGTQGLVTTAGKSYLPLVVSSLRMLRRTGSTLPAEVYMKDASEYEKKICENVLPDLDARCLVLSEIVGKEPIAHYQLKAFAVLFSSFEDIIWMDADCFPLHTPEELFEAEPFQSHGLVTWPDFWASTASPAYFELSRQPIPPLSVRQSSETGVFMISKRTNYITLLLAAYYNYYGPSHYFRLLSQGAPGEGDKETFLQAATAVGEPFYAVSEKVQALGHWKPDNQGLSGSAMAQADPREDFALTSQDKWRVQDPSAGNPPRIFFIHAHYPKFNPAENLFGSKWETAPTLKADGSEGRAWTAPEDVISRFGYDVEKDYWEEIKWMSCEPKTEFRTWENKAQICQQVESYWQHVFAEPHAGDPKFPDEAQ